MGAVASRLITFVYQPPSQTCVEIFLPRDLVLAILQFSAPKSFINFLRANKQLSSHLQVRLHKFEDMAIFFFFFFFLA
jgi:hypothetical protein